MKLKYGKGGRLKSFWHREIRRRWIDYQWTAVGLLALVALILGVVGFAEHYDKVGQCFSWLGVLYSAVQLYTLESGGIEGDVPKTLEIARWLAPGVLFYTAAKALLEIFRGQMQLFRVRFFRDHVVVCGLGEKGYALVMAARQKGHSVIVVELDQKNGWIASCRDQGAVVLVGDATDPQRLTRSRLSRASDLFSVCGDDSTNIAIAAQARTLAEQRTKGPLTCHTHVSQTDLADLVRPREIAGQDSALFRLDIFNIYQRGANALLSTYAIFPRREAEPAPPTHLVIVGLGPLGASLLISAARLWYVAQANRGFRFSLTLVDDEIEARWQGLIQRYPRIAQLQPTLISTGLRSPGCVESLAALEQQLGTHAHVCVCREDDNQSLADALALRNQLRTASIPIIVCMYREAGTLGLLQNDGAEHAQETLFNAFDLIDQTCTPELLSGGTNEVLARAIHNDYVQEQVAKGQTVATNPSMCAWEKLPATLQSSNRDQADHIGPKLRAIGYDIAPLTQWDSPIEAFDDNSPEVAIMAEMEHDRWVEEREADGWTYAPGKKDIERKTSPYLVAWDDERLPEDIKQLDRNTVKNLPIFLATAGFEIYRT